MTIWLFYDDSLRYSRVTINDKYLALDGWTCDEDIYYMRCDIFKNKGKIDCIEMDKKEYENFCQLYSDKNISKYSLMIGKSNNTSDYSNEDNIMKIEVPLSRAEYYEIHDAYDKYLSQHPEISLPPDIFKKKYAKALRILGMETFYCSQMDTETIDFLNSTQFAINNNILYTSDSFFDSYYMEPNEFSYFMLIYGKFLKKNFFKKYMKG